MTLTNSRLFIFLTWCHGPSFLSCHFGSQAHCLILSTRQSCFRRVWIFLIVWQEKIIRNNLNSFPLPTKSSVITFIIFLHTIDLLKEQNPVSCPFKIFHILDCPSASLFVVVVNFPSIPSVLCGLVVKDKALIGFRVTPYDPPQNDWGWELHPVLNLERISLWVKTSRFRWWQPEPPLGVGGSPQLFLEWQHRAVTSTARIRPSG